jgi:hypothetical protein
MTNDSDDQDEPTFVYFEFGRALGAEIAQSVFDGATNIRVHALLNALDTMSGPDAALAGLLATFVEIMRNQHFLIVREYAPELMVLH